jgi:uncharacterized protein
MLRSFRVANHQSIRDEQELSLLPTNDRDRAFVPVAAVFGANAAGKSSLVNALRFMHSAVKLSFATWQPGDGVSRTPFRLAARSLVEPSLFVVDVFCDWVQYVYGFTVDDEKIVDEWLYTYTKRRRRVVFERSGDHVDLGSATAENRAKGKVVAGMTRPNALYLSTAAQAGLPDVMPVYEWFARGLAFLPTATRTLNASLLRRLMPGSPDRDTIVDLVRAADVGIADIRVVDAGWRDRALEAEERALALRAELVAATGRRRIELAEQIAYYDWLIALREARSLHLEFYHGTAHAPLSFEHQSDGTRSWMALVLYARAALDAGSVLVVDELDASLHPRLTTRLVRLFQSRRTNPRGAQLVFTTHDASLLGTVVGEQVLQRDQIWFVEKDADGATSLFPLTDFTPEPDEDIQRRYLGGGFGGVPVVSEVSFRRALREKEESS